MIGGARWHSIAVPAPRLLFYTFRPLRPCFYNIFHGAQLHCSDSDLVPLLSIRTTVTLRLSCAITRTYDLFGLPINFVYEGNAAERFNDHHLVPY